MTSKKKSSNRYGVGINESLGSMLSVGKFPSLYICFICLFKPKDPWKVQKCCPFINLNSEFNNKASLFSLTTLYIEKRRVFELSFNEGRLSI